MLCVDIKKRLGDFRLDVQFNAGDVPLALLGASGCGKSMTLRCIAGILTPDEGKIVLDGVTLFDSTAHIDLPPQKRRLGYLFQQYALFPHMTVRQNIGAAIRERRERRHTVERLLWRFQLEAVAEQRPWQLSGGQQQRTALARILAAQPKAILLDEPFSALDSYMHYQLEMELYEALADFSGTVIWVSHDRGEVFRNCQQVCILDHGRSQPAATLEELFRHPGTEAAARLSGCKNYADTVPNGETVRIPQWGVTLDCGRPVPREVRRIGLRAHHVRFAEPGAQNAFSCGVERVIEDVFSMIVLLRPTGALPSAPLLRMELDKAAWQASADREIVTVAVAPHDILLLHEGEMFDVQRRRADGQ